MVTRKKIRRIKRADWFAAVRKARKQAIARYGKNYYRPAMYKRAKQIYRRGW